MSSKAFGKVKTKLLGTKNAASKFVASAVEGSRLIPSKTKDAEVQVRIDAGHYDPVTKKLNVVLQLNSQATTPVFKEYIKKHGTHAKLATAQFDTATEDPDKEFSKVVDELIDAGLKTIQNWFSELAYPNMASVASHNVQLTSQ